MIGTNYIYSKKEKLHENSEWECWGAKYVIRHSHFWVQDGVVTTTITSVLSFDGQGYTIDNEAKEVPCLILPSQN